MCPLRQLKTAVIIILPCSVCVKEEFSYTVLENTIANNGTLKNTVLVYKQILIRTQLTENTKISVTLLIVDILRTDVSTLNDRKFNLEYRIKRLFACLNASGIFRQITKT